MESKSALQRLWAPWRFSWIKESSNDAPECFICQNYKKSSAKDRENLILYRGEKILIIMNRYPYSNGHIMVTPVRHISDPRDLEPEEWAELGLLTQVSIQALENTMHPHGYNIGWNIGRVSGAGLADHIHQHIVPRWNGDTNFMPVLGETKVISQDLYESFDQLEKAIREMNGLP